MDLATDFFFSFCDVHLRLVDYWNRKDLGWSLGSIHLLFAILGCVCCTQK